MVTFFIAGGWVMWWLLILGLPLVALSGVFMFKARPRWLAIIRALTVAVLFASIAGVVTDLIAVAWNTTGVEEMRQSPDFHFIVIEGVGEALTPAALGFTLLSLSWLFVAVGMRRVQELE